MTIRQYSAVGVVGVGLFGLALIALHILDPDLSVVDEQVSLYALGDYGWLSRTGNVAMGIGLTAIALGLRATLKEGKRVTTSWVLILAAGFGFIVSGVFNTNPANTVESTTAGALHDLGGYISMLSLMVATWFLRGVFKRDEHYSDMDRSQTWFAILMSGALVAVMAFESILGLTQRILVAVVVSWLITLGYSIRSVSQHPEATRDPAQSRSA